MKSAEVQSFTILKQAFFKKEFKVRLPDQLLKQTHFSSEMKVHDFCQVFLGFILQFTLCNSEWFWASHFSLQQPPAVGTRPDTICSVTSSKQESQQTRKIPTSHGTSWSIYINHYCGHLSRFHKSYKRVTNWHLNTRVLIPKLTWNVTLIMAPLLVMAVVPTASPSWGQTLQITAITTNTTFCFVWTLPAVQTRWSCAEGGLQALLKLKIECLVLGWSHVAANQRDMCSPEQQKRAMKR